MSHEYIDNQNVEVELQRMLREAEDAVKTEKGWLTLEELKKIMEDS